MIWREEIRKVVVAEVADIVEMDGTQVDGVVVEVVVVGAGRVVAEVIGADGVVAEAVGADGVVAEAVGADGVVAEVVGVEGRDEFDEVNNEQLDDIVFKSGLCNFVADDASSNLLGSYSKF